MALGGFVSSPDDFREIQEMDDNLDLKSKDPKERMKELVLKAQKTTDKLPRDRREKWNILLNEISKLEENTENIWGDAEKNEIIDKVDQKVTEFILEYVAEKVRVREEERKRVEEKGDLLSESAILLSKYSGQESETDLSLFIVPELDDDLVKMNVDLDEKFKSVVDGAAKLDRIFENFKPKSGFTAFSLKQIDGFNDLLADRLQIQRKSLEEMGVDEVMVRKVLRLKEKKDYRDFVTQERDLFRDLFTRATPNGFVVKFDVLDKYKDKLSEEFFERFDNFAKFIRLQDLLEDFEMEGQIEGGIISRGDEKMVVKNYESGSDRLIGRKLEDGVNGEESSVKIYTNSVVEFNVRSLQAEYDLEGAKQDLNKEFNEEASFEELENQILDLKFNREIFERAGDSEALVRLEDKIFEGEFLLEWKNYQSISGYEEFFEVSDLESVDGWVENLGAFANMDFLEKLQSDFSDIDYDEDSLKEGDLMDMAVKVVGYKINRLQAKYDRLPIESSFRVKLGEKIQEESSRFIDLSLNIGDSREDKNALNEEMGLKRVSDYMINLGSFEKAYEYFVDKSAEIDSNNFQSENLRKVYKNFNERCFYILRNYLNNERDLVVATGSKPEDYSQYLEKVNKLAKFISGRGESIDMELESGSSALILMVEALRLPEKMVTSNWDSPSNNLINNYRQYKNELKSDLGEISKDKLKAINEACGGELDTVMKHALDEPKSVEEYSEKYITLRVLRDSLKGYDVDIKRYQGSLVNGVNDYKELCLKTTKQALTESGGLTDFMERFDGGFSNGEQKLVETLSDVQGFGWLDISDETFHNAVFIAKFSGLVGASLAASLLSTPFTGGTSLLVGATSVAAIATTASHVIYGKGYDTTEEAMIGIGAEAGVNFFGAYGGGSLGNALRVSALKKSTGLTTEAVKKGLLTGDEAISTGLMSSGEKALYFTGQMVGDVSLNAGLDIAVAKLSRREAEIFAEFEKSVSNPANWAVRLGGVSAGLVGGGKFNKFLSAAKDKNRAMDLSNLSFGEKRVIINMYQKSKGMVDEKLIKLMNNLTESGKVRFVPAGA